MFIPAIVSILYYSHTIKLALVRHLVERSPENTVYALARKPEEATELQELSKSEKNLYVIKFDLEDRHSIRVSLLRIIQPYTFANTVYIIDSKLLMK